MTEIELEEKTDRLLMNIKELYNLGIIKTREHSDLVRRTKSWWYDQRKVLREEGK